MDRKVNVDHLKNLGTVVPYDRYNNPDPALLEVFDNPCKDRKYATQFVFEEFTSLCLHGDTLIDVATDENNSPEGVPIKDLVGKTGVVFSFDIVSNKVVARKFHSVRKTAVNKPTVRVKYVLFKGASDNRTLVENQIICTPTHPFLVRVGWGKYKWVAAQDLAPKMQLVADQRSQDLIRGIPRHRLILENELGRELTNEEIVHHIDHNHFNNNPDNLEVMSSMAEHFSHHQTKKYGKEFNIQELIDLYNSGENFSSLAKLFGVDPSTIYSRIGHLVEKRTQAESLRIKNNSIELDKKKIECRRLYEEGYTVYELSLYYDRHATTISNWIVDAGGMVRKSHETSAIRTKKELPSLNHRVLSVTPYENCDVYNMEVEDTECFFANGVVVHNCPKTGQPDFGVLTIQYFPKDLCLETKALKIYLGAYRQHGSFMEAVTNKILDDLSNACKPHHMRIEARFNRRGGTDITVIAEYDGTGN